MNMSGSPNRVSPLPSLVIAHEDYAQFERLIQAGVSPRIEARVTNRIARVTNRIGRTPVQQWNTVAELRGSERPGQVVILGAHLDSWDLGTGVTDKRHRFNGGAGSRQDHRAIRPQAQADRPVHPLQRRRGRVVGLPGICRGSRSRGRQHSSEVGSGQRHWRDHRAGTARAGQSRGVMARLARTGELAGRVRYPAREQDGNRSSLVHSLQGAGLQLRPAAPRLPPHPSLTERHLRQGGRSRSQAGRPRPRCGNSTVQVVSNPPRVL
jgi:hypothetical protein